MPFYPLVGMPTSEVVTTPFQSNGQAVLRTTTRTIGYDVQAPAQYSVLPVTVSEATTDTLASGTVMNVSQHTVRESFDAYGNLTLRTEQWPLDNVARNTTITYQNNVAAWLVALPLLETVTSASTGESMTRQTGYEFDANGLLFRQTQDPGAQSGTSFAPLPAQADGVQTVYTQYTRNADGSPVRITTEDRNDGTGNQRFVEISYDSLERIFPVLTRDTLDHTVQSAYSPGLGVLAVQVDENGLTTTYQYDTFGRQRAIHPPTGDDVTVEYLAPSASAQFGQTHSTRAGGADVVTQLDSLGRAMQTATSYRADGQVVYATTEYDAQGHVTATSRPFFAGAWLANTVTTYDALGRPTLVTYPDGSSTTKTYLGPNVTTVDTDGNTRLLVTDGFGRPVKSTQVVSGASGSPSAHSTVTQARLRPVRHPREGDRPGGQRGADDLRPARARARQARSGRGRAAVRLRRLRRAGRRDSRRELERNRRDRRRRHEIELRRRRAADECRGTAVDAHAGLGQRAARHRQARNGGPHRQREARLQLRRPVAPRESKLDHFVLAHTKIGYTYDAYNRPDTTATRSPTGARRSS